LSVVLRPAGPPALPYPTLFRSAKLDEGEARLDALASRARTSALLPELRLRATRAVDESESLSPTEYDPLRRTASGGTSTWFEARSEEHTSELQSRENLVCRLLL